MKFSVCRGVVVNDAFLALEKWLRSPPAHCMAQQANLLQPAGEPFNTDEELQMLDGDGMCHASVPVFFLQALELWSKYETPVNRSPKQKDVIRYRSSPRVCVLCVITVQRVQTPSDIVQSCQRPVNRILGISFSCQLFQVMPSLSISVFDSVIFHVLSLRAR